jgi:dTDP-4-dehydrorhamnose reductase
MRIVSKNSADHYIFIDVVEVEGLSTILLDITDREAVRRIVDQEQVDVIVNCAAYTNVDKAETDIDLCRLLNATAPGILADAMTRVGGLLVHISTDYVFGGDPYNTPCREDQKGTPTGIYGQTKLEGEQAILQSGCQYVILRTAWLYSEFGKNFVKTMLNLTATKPSLKVVFDQVGTPTYALDLADCIVAVLTATEWHPGIYHVSDEGAISWYDFTMAIHRLAGITECRVSPCMTSEYPTRATRPHYSVLDKSKFKATFGVTLPHWEVSLRHCLQRIAQSEGGDQLFPLKISLN